MNKRARIGLFGGVVGCVAAACSTSSTGGDTAPASIGSAAIAISRGTVALTPTSFVVDGRPVLLRGGTLQWFRLPRATWDDRMKRFKAAGYNTIDMYVSWRNHEPREGQFDFTTFDIRAFLDLAKQNGLYVYFRPGPYITNELDGGGVPAWVFAKSSKKTRDANVADGTLNLRTNDRDYLDAVTQYFAALNEVVRPYLHTNGGPIVLYSVENEYNWFQSAFELDKLASYEGGRERPTSQTADVAGYLGALRDIVRAQGIDVPVTTCPGDGTTSGMDGVAGIVPMPNVYSSLGTIEQTGAALLRDMHDPTRNGGSYVGFPTGITETERSASVLRRFILGGMDAVFQFNAVGMAQEGYQNAVVLHGGAVSDIRGAFDLVRNLTDVRIGYATTGFVRPPVGYFHGVVDYYGAIGPSGTLREKFYSLRRTNLFLDSFEGIIAAAGAPMRSSSRARIAGDDRRVVVASDVAGVKDSDATSKVNYWLDLGDGAALLGLYNDGRESTSLGLRSIEAFGETFPRFTTVNVPVEDEPSVAKGAALEREYLKLVPIRLPITNASKLHYATSEVLVVRPFGGGKLVVLYGPTGTLGEARITGNGVRITASSAGVAVNEQSADAATVSYVHGEPQAFTVVDGVGVETRYVVLERDAAGRAWFVGEGAAEAMIVGPDYVETSGRAATMELADEAADVLTVSAAPVTLTGLAQASTYDAASGFTRFRTSPAPSVPPITVRLDAGRSRGDLDEAQGEASVVGWSNLGDAPDFLERHGVDEGHAWYRGEVDLTPEEARAPGGLHLGGVSDFAGLYMNGKYLLTVAPLGTDVKSDSWDSEYGFRIPSAVLVPGRNVIAIRNEIWGHGSFMFPRGTIDRIPFPVLGTVPLPFPGPSIPALGFDAMKGVVGPATLGKARIKRWSLRGKLGGELQHFDAADYNDAAWSTDTFPRALRAGEVVWYRTHFQTRDLPNPREWSAPVVLSLGGHAAKATVYLNGRLIARWLSDGTWLRRGSWAQAERDMWCSTPPDDFPIPRETLREGDNVLAVVFEDASDATRGGAPGLVDRLEMRLARENKVDTGNGTAPRSATHRRVDVRVEAVTSR